MRWIEMLTAAVLMAASALGQAAEEPSRRIAPEDLEPVAKAGIQRVLSRVLDVPVTVGEVNLLPDQELMELHNVQVANPEGFQAPNAITADKVVIEADIRSLFTRQPEIRLIQAVGAKVNAETRLPQGMNLKKLQANARAARLEGPLGGSGLRERMQKQWRIQKGILQTTEVTVMSPLQGQGAVTRTLENLEMDFLGENGQGMLAQEAVAKFITRLVEEMDLISAVAPGTGGVLDQMIPKGLGLSEKNGGTSGSGQERPRERVLDIFRVE